MIITRYCTVVTENKKFKGSLILESETFLKKRYGVYLLPIFENGFWHSLTYACELEGMKSRFEFP